MNVRALAFAFTTTAMC